MSTKRQEIIALLLTGQFGAKAVSRNLRMSEKEVYEHLVHIDKSLKSQHRRLIIIPAKCLECGYAFETRNRFTSPGKCPRCRGEHIQDPEYSIA